MSEAAQWPRQVELLLADRRLKSQAFSQDAVVALWTKAVDSARDASIERMSLDGALRAAYDAVHFAVTALLAVNGLKTSSGPGHHEVAFAAGAALAGGLDDLVATSTEFRLLRAVSMYDPVIASEDNRKEILAWVRATLPHLSLAIRRRDPSLPLVTP